MVCVFLCRDCVIPCNALYVIASVAWFKCTLSDALTAIEEVRTETRFEGNRTWNFSMRGEQQQAVNMTKSYFEQSKIDDPSRPPKFLWNAKMRFGKTFATYELCKAMGFNKILVLTFKPAVESVRKFRRSCRKSKESCADNQKSEP